MPTTVPYPNFVAGTTIDSEQVDANFAALVAAIDAVSALVAGTAFLPGDYKWTGKLTADAGFLACDGSAVSRTTYAALFAAIGTKHGAGNGSTTFNLPDLRGRVMVGLGTHSDVNDIGKSDAVSVGSRSGKHYHAATGLTATLSAQTGGESAQHVHGAGQDFLTFHFGGTYNIAGAGTPGAVSGMDRTTFTQVENVGHTHDMSHSHTMGGNVGDTGGSQDRSPYCVALATVKT